MAQYPSMCVKRKNKIIEKTKTVKAIWKHKHSKWRGLPERNVLKEKLPTLWKFECQMWLKKHLGSNNGSWSHQRSVQNRTKDGILNSLHTRNQFTTCTEGTVNISDVPSINVSLRECVGKQPYLVAKNIKDAVPKYRVVIIFVRAESQISCATQM